MKNKSIRLLACVMPFFLFGCGTPVTKKESAKRELTPTVLTPKEFEEKTYKLAKEVEQLGRSIGGVDTTRGRIILCLTNNAECIPDPPPISFCAKCPITSKEFALGISALQLLGTENGPSTVSVVGGK